MAEVTAFDAVERLQIGLILAVAALLALVASLVEAAFHNWYAAFWLLLTATVANSWVGQIQKHRRARQLSTP